MVYPAALTNDISAKGVWNDLGIGKWLDDWLTANGETDWVINLANEAFPSAGDTGAYGCGNRDQKCLTVRDIDDCPTMKELKLPEEYWVFNAVAKLQV